MKKTGIAIVLMLAIVSCNNSTKENLSSDSKVYQIKKEEAPTSIKDKQASAIINKAIQAHGGTLYDNAAYSFVFRKNEYHFKNKGKEFTYESFSKNKKGEPIRDVLVNNVFTRYVNNNPVALSEKDVAKYSEALNSVIYFATLPYKLSDAAVNKVYRGNTTIKETGYEVVEVSFNEEGGGTDHDDTYYYWINNQTNTVDYLAYNYTVNGGGARFRSFYNRRKVSGLIFQDYVNWEADKNMSLAKLPSLFEEGKLKELSKIQTENVRTIH